MGSLSNMWDVHLGVVEGENGGRGRLVERASNVFDRGFVATGNGKGGGSFEVLLVGRDADVVWVVSVDRLKLVAY